MAEDGAQGGADARGNADWAAALTPELAGAIARETREGVCIVRASDEAIVEASPRLGEILGSPAAALRGEPLRSLLGSRSGSGPATDAGIVRSLRGAGVWSGRLEALGRAGAPVWLSARIFSARHPEHGEVWVALLEDVSERVRLEQELERTATFDELTAMPNRRLFRAQLERERATVTRRGEPAALLAIGLDRIGTPAGLAPDAAARLVKHGARTVRSALRASDVLARVGEQELAAIVQGADRDDAAVVATKILRALRSRSVRIEGREQVVTASIGVAALHPTSGASAELLLAEADRAMAKARSAGGDRFAIAREEGLGSERPPAPAEPGLA